MYFGEKMNKLKFSHDYTKLPLSWEGTHAILAGIMYVPDMEQFKLRSPEIITADTEFRGESGNYDLNFREGILLTFIHLTSGKAFTTIRRHTPQKWEYYEGKVKETFELIKV